MKTSKLRRSYTPGRLSSKRLPSTKIPTIEARCPTFRDSTVSDLLLEKSNVTKRLFGTPLESEKSAKLLSFSRKNPYKKSTQSGRLSPKNSRSSSTGRTSPSVKAAQQRLEGILARCRRLEVDHEHLYSVSLLRQASADTSLIPTCLLSVLAALSFVLVVIFSGSLLLGDMSSCRNNSSQVWVF